MKIALSLEEMNLGGGPKFTLNLGHCLVRAGHRVTILAEREGEWWPELGPRNLSGYCLPPMTWSTLAQKAKALADHCNRERYDVLVINASILNRVAHCASHLLDDRISVILIFLGCWQALFDIALRDIAVWNCAVGVGPRVHELGAFFFPEKPVFCIPICVEAPDADQSLHRAEWELPLRLLYVGRLIDSHKGVLRLASILASCRRRGLPVTLTVIGDGEDRGRLVRRFAEEGVSDLVCMTGAQEPDSIAGAMQNYHLFIFPTNTEGMPHVVLEAQAAGCVVITTNLPGITDIAVADRISGRLAEPGNIEQFVDHISEMMDPAVWKAHSLAGIEHVREQFSLTAMGEQYERLLTDVRQGCYHVKRPYHATQSWHSVPMAWWELLPTPLVRVASRMRADLRTFIARARGEAYHSPRIATDGNP